MTGPCLGCLAAADHGVASCADCRAVLVAVPKPTRTERARRKLRPVNGPRRRRAIAEDFGDLAAIVRTLPCCVVGCEQGPSDPAHVRSRGAGHHAWLVIDERKVGNLAPLCRAHHDEQGRRGIRTFEASHKFTVRWRWACAAVTWIPAASLAEAAAAIGRMFEGRDP